MATSRQGTYASSELLAVIPMNCGVRQRFYRDPILKLVGVNRDGVLRALFKPGGVVVYKPSKNQLCGIFPSKSGLPEAYTAENGYRVTPYLCTQVPLSNTGNIEALRYALGNPSPTVKARTSSGVELDKFLQER